VLTPLVATAAGLLVLAGVLKLRAREWAGGAVEVGLGAVALFVARPLVVGLVAVAYAGFAAHSLRLRVVSGGEADCGCFGDVEATAGYAHVVLNVACACACAAAVVAPTRSLAALVVDVPVTGLVVVAGVAASVYGLFLAYTALPGAWNSFQPGLRGS
jgi:hypothetical protein